MPRYRGPALGLALLIIGSISLSACIPDDAGPTKMEAGGQFEGELTTDRSRNLKDGSRYQALSISLPSGQVGVFELNAGFGGTLSLYDDARDQLVADSGEDPQFYDYQEGPISLAYRSEQGGTHTLVVSGTDVNSYGPFTVAHRVVDLDSSRQLTVDESVTGWMEGEVALWTLEIEETGLYVIDMISDHFDAYLELTGDGFHRENDDGGEGLNAQLQIHLEPGRYQVTARGYDVSRSQGLYELSTRRTELPQDELQSSGPLAVDGSVVGLLQDAFADYSLTVDETGLFTIDLESSAFDAVLHLEGEGLVLSDDDGGVGTDSRIETLLTAGDYRLRVESYGYGDGLFTLSNQRTELPEGVALKSSGELDVPAHVKGVLALGEGNAYSLVVSTPGSYTIDLRSSSFDAFLELSGNGVEQVDDDGGRGTDSRIQTRLEAGEYRINVKDAFDHGSGLYDLEVR